MTEGPFIPQTFSLFYSQLNKANSSYFGAQKVELLEAKFRQCNLDWNPDQASFGGKPENPLACIPHVLSGQDRVSKYLSSKLRKDGD